MHISTPAIVAPTMKMGLLLWLLLALARSLPLVSSFRPAQPSLSEERRTEKAEANIGLDVNDVSNMQESAALRNYLLHNKKQTGFSEERPISLASVLFPSVSPREYQVGEDISVYAGLVESLASPIVFQHDDLPIYSLKSDRPLTTPNRTTIGARLHGPPHEGTPSPFLSFRVKQNQGCTPISVVTLDGEKIRLMRDFIRKWYRVQLILDDLPVLMRKKDLTHYAVRGYPIGFVAPPSSTGLEMDELSLYNRFRFAITYQEDPSAFEGVRITGFDVHPVSIEHQHDGEESITPSTKMSTCNKPGAQGIIANNLIESYLPLRAGPTGEPLKVVYSYEVEWVASDLKWADRWDVYTIGLSVDDLHYFAMLHAFCVASLVTCFVVDMIIRTSRQDIAGYIERQALEEAKTTTPDVSQDATTWQLLEGDVFRPPQFSPMLLSVLVGTGVQIGVVIFVVLTCAALRAYNPIASGATLTFVLFLYTLCGFASGYVSARLYKFCNSSDDEDWKRCAAYTSIALPGGLLVLFCLLNVPLSLIGAATAVSLDPLLSHAAMWACFMVPSFVAGSCLGRRVTKIKVPVETNEVVRDIPQDLAPWQPFAMAICCGVFTSSTIGGEWLLVMCAMWLDLTSLLVIFALSIFTCAGISIVVTYEQLRLGNHRWWWQAFWNGASAGGSMMCLLSLLFLLKLPHPMPQSVLSVWMYLMYSGMICICFGLLCGSISFLASFAFTRFLYNESLSSRWIDTPAKAT